MGNGLRLDDVRYAIFSAMIRLGGKATINEIFDEIPEADIQRLNIDKTKIMRRLDKSKNRYISRKYKPRPLNEKQVYILMNRTTRWFRMQNENTNKLV